MGTPHTHDSVIIGLKVIMIRKTKNITLIITRWCNLKCTYCYEHHKSQQMMSVDLALRLVTQALNQAETQKYEVLHITFMGGEPFYNFKVIKCVVEWSIKQKSHVLIEASAATNGTMITQEVKDWLTRHRNVLKIQLSYDGGVSQQITNRTPKPLDLRFFLTTFPIQGVHITISKDTLPSLSDSVTSLVSIGARCSTNLAAGTNWSNDDAMIYLRELRVIAENYLAKYADVEPIPILSCSLGLVGEQHPQAKPSCNGLTYDVDGTAYPCHLFSPIVVGDERAICLATFEQDEDLKQYGGKDDPHCTECPLCNWCPTCYGFNYLFTGSTGTRDHRTCKMMFAQAFAASEYQINYFRKVGITEANAHRAKAAIRAYRMLRERNYFHSL